MQLFRKEALAANHPRLHGEILVRGSWMTWGLIGLIVLIVTGILAVVVFGQYTRRVTVSGYLIPAGGVVRIYSAQAGRATKVHVAEGDAVSAGQLLVTVADERPDSSGGDSRLKSVKQVQDRKDNIESVIKQQGQLFDQTDKGLNLRIAALHQEMAQLLAEQKMQSSRIVFAKNTLKRHVELAAQNYVSETVVQEKQDAVVEQEAKLQTLQRTHSGLRRELEALLSEQAELPMRRRTQIAELRRGVNQAEQELIELGSKKEIVVTSPQSGIVSGLAIKPGQLVTIDRSLMILLPQNNHNPNKPDILEGHLYAQSKDAGFLRVGQEVMIRYGAYPYQKFGQYRATITEVSRTPFLLSELPFPIAAKGAPVLPNEEPVYRLRVMLESQNAKAYGMEQPLQSGMQMEADVMLDTRTVLEWMLEPIYSLRGRYSR